MIGMTIDLDALEAAAKKPTVKFNGEAPDVVLELIARVRRSEAHAAALVAKAEEWWERWQKLPLKMRPEDVSNDPAIRAAWLRENDVKTMAAWHIVRDLQEMQKVHLASVAPERSGE